MTRSPEREQGAFPSANLARLIPMFPATSDASWTRMLHTKRFAGLEYGHFNPVKDKVYNKAVGGLLVHLVPPLEELPFTLPTYAQAPAYYKAFDYHASAYLDALWSYDRPFYGYYRGLDNLFVALEGRSQVQDTFSAYVLETDVVGHLRSQEDVVNALVSLSDRIERFKREHPERTFVFTLLAITASMESPSRRTRWWTFATSSRRPAWPRSSPSRTPTRWTGPPRWPSSTPASPMWRSTPASSGSPRWRAGPPPARRRIWSSLAESLGRATPRASRG